MFSYTASQDNEITIKKDDIVDVITMETGQDGWWLVRYSIQEGLAPSNYLSLIQSEQSSLTSNFRGIIKIFLNYYISRLYNVILVWTDNIWHYEYKYFVLNIISISSLSSIYVYINFNYN